MTLVPADVTTFTAGLSSGSAGLTTSTSDLSTPFYVITTPAADFANDGPVDEGDGASIAFTNPTSPFPDFQTAGFRYAYDIGNTGLFNVGDGTYAGSSTSPTWPVKDIDLPNGPGTFEVRGRVIAADDSFRDYTTTIIVQNVAPSDLVIAPSITPVNEGSVVSFSGQFTDPGTEDTHNLVIDWGDGSAPTTIALSPGTRTFSAIQHVYSDSLPNATYTVSANVSDGLEDTTTTTSITVLDTAVAALTPFIEGGPDAFQLTVVGGQHDDTIRVVVKGATATEDQYKVRIASRNGRTVTRRENTGFVTAPGTIGRVLVYGLEGDDNVRVNSSARTQVWTYGGDGDDVLDARPQNSLGLRDRAPVATTPVGFNILVGGAGNDLLWGNAGQTLLIGGEGADRIYGRGGEDILVAGSTDFDTPSGPNIAAFNAIMSEWTSARNYTTRVANLLGPVTTGVNASFFLNSTTVHDDDDFDRLFGGSQTDWFMAHTLSPVADKTYGNFDLEIITELS